MDFQKIRSVSDIELLEDINLEKYTTIKLANIGSIAIVKSKRALQDLLHILISEKMNYHLVGWGANQVLLNSKGTLFIKLDFEFNRDYLKVTHDLYDLPASLPLTQLSSHAQKFGLVGWEVFTGIPASLGGAIYMNAGTALGEIGDLVESVDILQIDGKIRIHKCSKESFSYRKNHIVGAGEIIIGAKIKNLGLDEKIKTQIKDYLEYRKSTQPLTTKNCGSVFKNYNSKIRAGQTIDSIGLQQFGFENLKVSRKHANFVENSGNASAKDFNFMVECLKIDIERYSGLKFELEVKVY